ncbi:ABC transporter permease subunit [Mycoplasma iguanae]|uniref:ABC transporter permease subunit n=1 Tax=Mycoplasma iguanae TaxID=292461 RepID=A0ABY5RCC4_9MOLU|nr:ABC transporter permease subunit [Mycoplasma iguanae]UVD81987.1 ABC transporter permease subunit [Mycoplasma iguanae]
MSKIWDFITSKEILKKSYVWIILIIFYIPIIFGTVYSFNAESTKGDVSLNAWNKTTWAGWANLFEDELINKFINSFIIAMSVSLIVIVISLITVYSIWKQRSRMVKSVINGTSSIPLINPDIITAVGLSIVLSILFGSLLASEEGLWRAIVSHSIMCLPYGILFMLPRSDKFSQSLMEASQDLGYGPFKTWFKTYFIYMMPSIVFVFIITTFLSFDDFIITRIVSNTETIGTALYEGKFKTWSLALAAIMLLLVIIGNLVYFISKAKRRGEK